MHFSHHHLGTTLAFWYQSLKPCGEAYEPMVTVTSVCFTSAKTTVSRRLTPDRVPCLFPSKLTRLYIKRYRKPSCLGSLEKQTLEILRTQPPKLMGWTKKKLSHHSLMKNPSFGEGPQKSSVLRFKHFEPLGKKKLVSIIYIYTVTMQHIVTYYDAMI